MQTQTPLQQVNSLTTNSSPSYGRSNLLCALDRVGRGWGIYQGNCFCMVPTHLLYDAFIHLEQRIEHLHRFRWNHHGRQLAKWLRRWQARIEAEIAKRPPRRMIWRDP
jgi:hypothetical protein